MKKFLQIFFLALFINFIWENIHSLLYLNYKGSEITEYILFKASLGDAVMIVIILIPFIYLNFFKKHSWLIIIIGIIIAISIEWYALGTSRWSYNDLMPIIPFINVGLTPTIQLGLTGYLTYKILYRL